MKYLSIINVLAVISMASAANLRSDAFTKVRRLQSCMEGADTQELVISCAADLVAGNTPFPTTVKCLLDCAAILGDACEMCLGDQIKEDVGREDFPLDVDPDTVPDLSMPLHCLTIAIAKGNFFGDLMSGCEGKMP